MRKIIESQMTFREVDISKIEFDPRSRDEIPKLLMGLQYIYCTPKIRDEVFQILEEIVPEGTDSDNGRPGMLLWKILVLGTLRLNCNWDYDKVKEIADNHKTLRQMLGHGDFEEDDYQYPIQTIKDNCEWQGEIPVPRKVVSPVQGKVKIPVPRKVVLPVMWKAKIPVMRKVKIPFLLADSKT